MMTTEGVQGNGRWPSTSPYPLGRLFLKDLCYFVGDSTASLASVSLPCFLSSTSFRSSLSKHRRGSAYYSSPTVFQLALCQGGVCRTQNSTHCRRRATFGQVSDELDTAVIGVLMVQVPYSVSDATLLVCNPLAVCRSLVTFNDVGSLRLVSVPHTFCKYLAARGSRIPTRHCFAVCKRSQFPGPSFSVFSPALSMTDLLDWQLSVR